MKTVLAVSALALSVFASAIVATSPVLAADTAACQASWLKMDTKKVGFVMSADHRDHMDRMTKAGRTTAASDRMTDKEYMAACIADLFEQQK